MSKKVSYKNKVPNTINASIGRVCRKKKHGNSKILRLCSLLKIRSTAAKENNRVKQRRSFKGTNGRQTLDYGFYRVSSTVIYFLTRLFLKGLTQFTFPKSMIL